MEKLEIMSDNPDFIGVWTREEVEKEMRDVGCVGNWLVWVFDHNFDDYPAQLLSAMQLASLDFLIASVTISGYRTNIKLMKVSHQADESFQLSWKLIRCNHINQTT